MILSGSALFPVLRCSSTTFLKFRAMATVQSIVRELDRFAPLALAEKWDNVGLLLEPSTSSNLGEHPTTLPSVCLNSCEQ